MTHLATLMGWSAYLLWRAPEWGMLTGVPLTPLSIAALFGAWWIWFVRGRLPGVRLIWFLLALKIIGGALLLPRGLQASYFSNGGWTGTPEKGLYASSPGTTRVDRTLSFGSGASDLPLYFLNDVRFNRSDVIGEPLSVEWKGYLIVAASGTDLHLYLAAGGVDAEAFIDGFRVVALSPTEVDALGRVTARPGVRRLTVRMTSPRGIPQTFQAGIAAPMTGARRPFAASEMLQAPASSGRRALDRLLFGASVVADGVALACLGFGVLVAFGQLARRAPRTDWRVNVRYAIPLVAVVDALWFAHDVWGRSVQLGWGSDPLSYESLGREILLAGPLMLGGAPLGHGTPYYLQPLYPYFLSAVHLLTGESLWGVFLCQQLLLAVTVYAIWSIADLLFDTTVSAATLVLACWFTATWLRPFPGTLYSEILFIPLLCLWTLWLCRAAASPPAGRLATGAILGGLAALTRSTLMAAWPPILLLLALAYRRHRRSVSRVIILAALMTSVVGMATIRNWIVARQFVPITTSMGINLLAGNPPPESIAGSGYRHRWISWIAKDDQTAAVAEYAYEAPGQFLKGLFGKGAYALGVESVFALPRPAAFATARGILPTLAWIWTAALVGAFLLPRTTDVSSASMGIPRVIPVAVALSHLAVIVLIFPYDERFVLPFYALLIPYAAIPFGALGQAVSSRLP